MEKKTFYLWDQNKTRLTLIKTGKNFNWLFLPGGPGIDSKCFTQLTNTLNLPGNIWHVDLPGNGSNRFKTIYNDPCNWGKMLVDLVQKLSHPIIVGHSFGAMLTLSEPKIEQYLTGMVIINSTPKAWKQETDELSNKYKLPSVTHEADIYFSAPNDANFNALVIKSIPYLFSKKNYKIGKEILHSSNYNHMIYHSWVRLASTNYNVSWIPKRLPTLIIGSDKDYATPFSLYKSDKRFKRKNIQIVELKNSSHFCWLDQPYKTCSLIEGFATIINDCR